MPERSGMSYPEEDKLKEELALRLHEKRLSRFTLSLMRQGFANSPRQAQIVVFILLVLMLASSVYFYSTTLEKNKIVPRDPYVRQLPGY